MIIGFAFISLFNLPDNFSGGVRFLAYNAPNPVNHGNAKYECQKRSASLPRYQPKEDIGSVGTRFGPLSTIRGLYLHIWLDKCTLVGCYVWAVDVQPGHVSHYKTLLSTTTDSIFFVVCEQGEPTIINHSTILY